MIERWFERFLFASRWLLAPLYVALVVGLATLLVKVAQHVAEIVAHILSASEAELVLGLLGLIDLTLMGSLLVIVILSGYENFVSRIDTRGHPDWPEWLATIDFTGLKMKLMSSIVAISAVQLLRAFMDLSHLSDRDLAWTVGIHLTFVVSGLLFALTDRVGAHAPPPATGREP